LFGLGREKKSERARGMEYIDIQLIRVGVFGYGGDTKPAKEDFDCGGKECIE
jgi:hypothetical protein